MLPGKVECLKQTVAGLNKNYFKFFGNFEKAINTQSVEHETLNLRVVGTSPTLGANVKFKKSCY